MIHIMLSIRRYFLYRGIKRTPKYVKKPLIEQAQADADPTLKKEDLDDSKDRLEGKNDEMTDSEEEDYAEEETGYGLEHETKVKLYNFKHSFLYEMAWADLNDHYGAKLAFYLG